MRQDDHAPVGRPPLVRWDGLALVHAPSSTEPVTARPIFIVTLPFANCPTPAPAEASRDWVCRSITLDPDGASPNVHIVTRSIVDASPELLVPAAEACARRRARPVGSTGAGQGAREDMECRPAVLTIR
jgi:hypothetical protein